MIEVGLGGRLDATNVIATPVVCGITQLGLDHQSFLGDTLGAIAREKAGIAKPGMPVLTQNYEAGIAAIVREEIVARGGMPIERKQGWDIAAYRGTVHYRDEAGRLDLTPPVLAGEHQIANLGLSTAMLRHQNALPVSDAALKAAPRWAQWPGRLQRLDHGPLLAALPEACAVWLDGGHNPAAGAALAEHFHGMQGLTVIVGMLANKDVMGFLAPLWPMIGKLHSVPVQAHAYHGGETFGQLADAHGVAHRYHDNLEKAIAGIAITIEGQTLLITGSLYLAGEVLAANGQLPG